jgi:uncharacterized protein with GYD domain
LLSTLTPDGRQTLHKNPDRLDEVNTEIEEFGCKVLSQYALLGGYDFVTIIEAPDNATVAHLSVDLGSRGTVNIETHPALDMGEFRAKLKGPKQMGHG